MPIPFSLPLDVPPPVPHVRAAAMTTPIVLDGVLDDPAWAAAPVTDSFTQKRPDAGKAAPDPTRVRVIYDKEAVYVGIECVQTVPVVPLLSRRDRRVEADWVSVGLDSRHDGTTGFEFTVNAAGVLSDGIYFNDTDFSDQWDENWEAKAAVTKQGWSVEIKIPLRILRFDAEAEQSWGMQVRRYTSNRQELDEWSFIPRDAGGEISHYGKLDGLKNLQAGNPLELRPFIVGRLRNYGEDEGTLARGVKPQFSVGLDLKWHINQNLTLDATFNPDFGQVEADQVILNLSTFELYFPEKRTFFLEGADTFATPLQVLYTRRIGRAPDSPSLRTDAPFNEQLYRLPEPSPIYGAAKLTGQVGRWTVGELIALTGRQTVPVQMGDGTLVDRTADPYSTYKVLRLKRAFGENSHVGMIALATNRLESAADYPRVNDPVSGRPMALCPSGDVLPVGQRCTHDAYVGGVDGRWRSSGGDYVASGQVIATSLQNGPPRTAADGTVLKGGDLGAAAMVHLAKEGGKHWVGYADYGFHGRNVDYNDLGYMQRQNRHKGFVEVEYRELEPFSIANEAHGWIDLLDEENLDLLNLQRGANLGTFWKFKNFWGLYLGGILRGAHHDDREVGNGAALERTWFIGPEGGVSSDTREPVSFDSYFNWYFRPNGYSNELYFDLKVKPSTQLELDLIPDVQYTQGEPRFVEQATPGNYLFGRQKAESLSFTLRGTYTFTPRLTLQAYAQAFLASVHYSDFARFVGPGTPQIHLSDLVAAPEGPQTSADFREAALNANVVLRWEYRLGSTLFLVYTHAQDKSLTPFKGDPGDIDFALLKPRLASDVFLFKLAYWWS